LSTDLTLDWQETGGPEPSRPHGQGFGTKVITASIEGQLGGHASFDWQPEGLRCTLTIPSRRTRNETAAPPSQAIAANGDRRVLLVEDEPLVAMMMEEALGKLGYTVAGPFARLGDALAAAGRDRFHAAVLDVNLGGELVFPLAERLSEQGTPFVFVTGYGPERIDVKFAHVPVLHKPVQLEALEGAFAGGLRKAAE
jgi:CheY-like chemotaxis protein